MLSTILAWLVVGNTLWWHRFEFGPRIPTYSVPPCGGEDAFEDVWPVILQSYYKKIPDTAEAKATCRESVLKSGLSACLDPFSRFLGKEDTAEVREDLRGSIDGGVGLDLRVENGHVVVLGVTPNAPADFSKKIEKGDVIVAIDDESTDSYQGLSNIDVLRKVVNRLRGSPGSTVTVVVEKSDSHRTEPVVLERSEIVASTVSGAVMREDVAYVRIRQFTGHTPEQFLYALFSTALRDDGSWRPLIIDLRGNTGGSVQSALLISYLFARHISDVMITYISENLPSESKQVIDLIPQGVIGLWSDAGRFADVPFLILTDNHTASASEIFIGIMRDWRKTLLIGTHTFGKGVMETVLELPRGRSIALTTHEFLLGNSRIKVHGVGFAPDVEVVSEHDIIAGDMDHLDDRSLDNQLEVAIGIARTLQ